MFLVLSNRQLKSERCHRLEIQCNIYTTSLFQASSYLQRLQLKHLELLNQVVPLGTTRFDGAKSSIYLAEGKFYPENMLSCFKLAIGYVRRCESKIHRLEQQNNGWKKKYEKLQKEMELKVQDLNNELMLAKAHLDKKTNENAMLKSRIGKLEHKRENEEEEMLQTQNRRDNSNDYNNNNKNKNKNKRKKKRKNKNKNKNKNKSKRTSVDPWNLDESVDEDDFGDDYGNDFGIEASDDEDDAQAPHVQAVAAGSLIEIESGAEDGSGDKDGSSDEDGPDEDVKTNDKSNAPSGGDNAYGSGHFGAGDFGVIGRANVEASGFGPIMAGVSSQQNRPPPSNFGSNFSFGSSNVGAHFGSNVLGTGSAGQGNNNNNAASFASAYQVGNNLGAPNNNENVRVQPFRKKKFKESYKQFYDF